MEKMIHDARVLSWANIQQHELTMGLPECREGASK